MTRKEEGQRLLKRSRDFLETAKFQTDNGLYDLATFSLQQALELFLKSKVLEQGVNYPRTHSVRALLEMLYDLAVENKKPAITSTLENYLLELGVLEDAYITSRYITREFTKQEAEKLTKAVKEIIKNVA